MKEKLSTKAFDEQILRNSSSEDIDEDAIECFFELISDESLDKIKDKRSNEQILDYIGAGKIDNNGNFHLTNAGALFFAKDVSKFDIEHEVKMVRFYGNNRISITDRLTSYNTIFILLKEFERFFKNNTKLGFIVNEFERYTGISN